MFSKSSVSEVKLNGTLQESYFKGNKLKEKILKDRDFQNVSVRTLAYQFHHKTYKGYKKSNYG